MLGFVTGQVMGQSRESAVGTVVPAVLTLLGGVAVYVVGSKGVEVQANVSAMVLCFAVTLLIGTLFGSKMRFDYDYAVADPVRLRNRELALQQNRSALGDLEKLLPAFDATKMPPNDSALFPLRFTGVHGAAGLDQQRDRFFEVPL